ncbi:MAG: helix-turn-helix transcriptional regulator [Tissierellales bacterium]|jgi:transcriptional regulator with XRE-family HTH domain|nr:helix-turn-helix transcriptional regulator [Tissierellales bacterium]
MIEVKKYFVPNILPNNLKKIREGRGLSVREVAEALEINDLHLNAVENGKVNFSGKTTLKALKYFNISFYKLYDIRENDIELDVIDVTEHSLETSISLDGLSEIDKSTLTENKDLLEKVNNQIFSISELGILKKIDIISVDIERSYVQLKAIYTIKYSRKEVFDINMMKTHDRELSRTLRQEGFPKYKKTIKKKYRREDIEVRDGKTYYGDSIFIEGNVISINSRRYELDLDQEAVEIKSDEDTGELYVQFKIIMVDMNNIKKIREHIGLSADDMSVVLDMTKVGYTTVEGGEKISTKKMWILCNFFKVPLEVLLNVEKYYATYCL